MKNLGRRKKLAAKVLEVGLDRIIFDNSNLEEIKEAITKQDIRDLYAAGAIKIREKIGRLQKEKRTTRRGPGKIKLIVKNKKKSYATLTRKLRAYIEELRKQGKITFEKYSQLRTKIKSGEFRDKAHIKTVLGVK